MQLLTRHVSNRGLSPLLRDDQVALSGRVSKDDGRRRVRASMRLAEGLEITQIGRNFGEGGRRAWPMRGRILASHRDCVRSSSHAHGKRPDSVDEPDV